MSHSTPDAPKSALLLIFALDRQVRNLCRQGHTLVTVDAGDQPGHDAGFTLTLPGAFDHPIHNLREGETLRLAQRHRREA